MTDQQTEPDVDEPVSGRELLTKAMADLGLTIHAAFVPWSKSRSKDDKERGWDGKLTNRPRRSLNWTVTLKRAGVAVVSTDYTAGIGSCPSYKPGDKSADQQTVIETECERGYRARVLPSGRVHVSMREPISPDAVEVLAALVGDYGVIDAGGFESWAREFDMDPDSRKAEAIYTSSLDLALKMRAGIGDAGMVTLQTAAREF